MEKSPYSQVDVEHIEDAVCISIIISPVPDHLAQKVLFYCIFTVNSSTTISINIMSWWPESIITRMSSAPFILFKWYIIKLKIESTLIRAGHINCANTAICTEVAIIFEFTLLIDKSSSSLCVPSSVGWDNSRPFE